MAKSKQVKRKPREAGKVAKNEAVNHAIKILLMVGVLPIGDIMASQAARDLRAAFPIRKVLKKPNGRAAK